MLLRCCIISLGPNQSVMVVLPHLWKRSTFLVIFNGWLRAVMVQPELSNRVCMTAIGDPQRSEIMVLLGGTCSNPVRDTGIQGSQGHTRFMFGLPHHQ